MSDPYRTSAEPKIDLRAKGSSSELPPFVETCPKCKRMLTHEFQPGFHEPESSVDLNLAWRKLYAGAFYGSSYEPTQKDKENAWYRLHGTIEGEHFFAKCACGYRFKCQCADHPKPPAT